MAAQLSAAVGEGSVPPPPAPTSTDKAGEEPSEEEADVKRTDAVSS